MSVVGLFSPSQTWTNVANANIALPHPDPRSGDLEVAVISARPSSVTIAAPAGWTEVITLTGTDGGAEGVDTGSVRTSVFQRVADGTEGTSTATFTKTGTASVIHGTIFQGRSSTGSYVVDAYGGGINGDTTNWTVAGLAGTGAFTEDDVGIIITAQNGDLATVASYDVFGTNLGAPAKTSRLEHGEFTTTTGNDQRMSMATFQVLPGWTNTGTVTVSATTSVAASGVILVIRVREGAGTPRSDVWVRAAGPQTVNATTPTAFPSEHVAGDRLLLVSVSRHSTDATPATPTDWTLVGSWVGGSGTFGIDAGNARVTVWYRDVSSTIGTFTVPLTGASLHLLQCFTLAKDPGDTWASLTAAGNGRTVQEPWSVTLDASIDMPTDAVALAVFGVNTDAMTTVQSPTISASGATFGDTTITSWWETSTGNDGAIAAFTTRITAGATATPTIGIDFTGTAGTNYPAGAAALIVGSIVSAAPPNEGAASGAIAWSGSATGARSAAGGATGAVSWTGSATGARPSTGTATGAVSWTGTATGQRASAGAASGTVTWSGTATGARSSTGSATGAISWTGSASGTRPSTGTAAGAVSWTGSASGARPSTGAATGSVAWASSASGARPAAGTASGTITWSGSATGEAPIVGPNDGTASGAITWTGSATGARTSSGTATGAISWTGTATGARPAVGAATGSVTWSGTTSGRRPAGGTASGAITWAGTATGVGFIVRLILTGPRILIDLTAQRDVIDHTAVRSLIDRTPPTTLADLTPTRDLIDRTPSRTLLEV